MGMFSRKSRVPDLKPDQYDAVVQVFNSNIDVSQEGAKKALAKAQENSTKTHLDLLTVPLGQVRALDVIKSFVDFALVPLDDVYMFHSKSYFLSDVSVFTQGIQQAYSAKEVQRNIRLLSEQGIDVSIGQQAAFVRPLLAQHMHFGQEPHSRIWAMATAEESQAICNYLILQLLIQSWLTARETVDAGQDVLGLACGWILLQWLEWCEVTPEAFSPVSK